MQARFVVGFAALNLASAVTPFIMSLAAGGRDHSTTLKVEIEQITKEKKSDEKALDVMVELRKKEAAEFTGEEKEMVESIKALEAAIIVLGEYHGKDHGVKLKGGKASLVEAMSSVGDVVKG